MLIPALALHSRVDVFGSTVPEPDELQVSKIVAALERAWAAIASVAHELPAAAIVVASGTEGLKVARWGHWGAARWVALDGVRRGEVLIAGERLAHGPIEVLGTLVHEAAHALAHARQIQDTSRQGRYHNDRYRQLAEELGLVVSKDDTYGWTITRLSDAAVHEYRLVLDDLEAALLGYRADLPQPTRIPAPADPGEPADPSDTTSKPRKTSTRQIVIVCQCPQVRMLRVPPAMLLEGPICCGSCGSPFEAVV